MQTRRYDDLIISRWRLEPRLRGLELGDVQEHDPAPPLWKDLTFASVVALLLWIAAAVAFG